MEQRTQDTRSAQPWGIPLEVGPTTCLEFSGIGGLWD